MQQISNGIAISGNDESRYVVAQATETGRSSQTQGGADGTVMLGTNALASACCERGGVLAICGI